MFSSLLFLILTLLVVNLAPEASDAYWQVSPSTALAQGLACYLLLVGAIVLQNRLFRKSFRYNNQHLLFITNIQLITFLLVYHFLIVAHRIYAEGNSAHTFLSIISLAFYFGGLALFHYTSYSRIPSSAHRPKSATEHTIQSLRFILPFTIPFLLFGLLIDMLSLFPSEWLHNMINGRSETFSDTVLLFSLTIAFMGGILVLLPPMMVKTWGCRPIGDTEVVDRLKALCRRARFRYSNLMLWTVMRHSLTAAILGVVPRFRYVLFTETLLKKLPIEQIEAILAHEIAHSKRRHLLIYPFIIMGMLVVAGLFFLLFGDAITFFFGLQGMLGSSSLWRAIFPLAIFLPYAIIIATYFRLIFGLFSRLFERQADIHGFSIGIPPQEMINALDSVAIYSGNSHKDPSWHHYSIAQRIEFLQKCRAVPALIAAHHRKVNRMLSVYAILLVSGTALLISPIIPEGSPGASIGQRVTKTSTKIGYWFTRGLRGKVAASIAERYQIKEDKKWAVASLDKALKDPIAIEVPGIAEFYAAQYLFHIGKTSASAHLMIATWEQFDFPLFDDTVDEDFEAVTEKILQELYNKNLINDHTDLLAAMTRAK